AVVRVLLRLEARDRDGLVGLAARRIELAREEERRGDVGVRRALVVAAARALRELERAAEARERSLGVARLELRDAVVALEHELPALEAVLAGVGLVLDVFAREAGVVGLERGVDVLDDVAAAEARERRDDLEADGLDESLGLLAESPLLGERGGELGVLLLALDREDDRAGDEEEREEHDLDPEPLGGARGLLA